MSVIQKRILDVKELLSDAGARVEWFPLLMARLTVGVVFLQSGWGKLHNLPKVIGYFTSLGLPAPEFQARLVSATEFGGGVLVLVGVLSRLASLPLAITMVVAIVTAKTNELRDVTSVFGFNEYAYLTLLAIIATRGPGAASVDAIASRFLTRPAGGEASPVMLKRLALVGGTAFGLLLAGITSWAALANHNPCDHVGPGFGDLVTKSHSEDDADEAWAVCKKIQKWQAEGKDAHQELLKEQAE